MNVRLLSAFAAVAALSAARAPAAPLVDQDVLLNLPAPGWDMELDVPRQRLYVSLPTLNSIAVVSTQSWSILQQVVVGPSPKGIDVSLDGAHLFVALNQAGAVEIVDLDTFSMTQVPLAAQLGDSRTYDVIEGRPNRLYVSADPNSSGFAYIVQVKLDQGNAASRVANGQIIRAEPTFARSPDSHWLYVGEGFSPESLYKLDIAQDTGPIVLQAPFGSVSGTDRLQISPDGQRLYMHGGQVLRTSDLLQAGVIGPGLSRFDEDPSHIYVSRAPNFVDVFSTSTFLQIGGFTLPCTFVDQREFRILPNGGGYIVLGDSKLCGRVVPGGCSGTIATYCSSLPNSTGSAAVLGSTGTSSISTNNLVLVASQCPAHTLSQFIYGAAQTQIPFGNGTLCISPFSPGLLRLGPSLSTDASGVAQRALNFSVPPLSQGPITSFSTWNFQAIYRDPQGGGQRFNTTGALQIDFCP